jgi:hypothetical protein
VLIIWRLNVLNVLNTIKYWKRDKLKSQSRDQLSCLRILYSLGILGKCWDNNVN